MNDDQIQKNQSDTEQFQKYPKVFQENKHYKSVKEKLMTASDDQDIIKFPLRNSTFQSAQIFESFSSSRFPNKVLKFQGRNVQTVPIRTISYSAPVKNDKDKKSTKFSSKPSNGMGQNIFDSKNVFSNMKKLKDLRKTNYKKRILQTQKKPNSQRQCQSDEDKLDLFRLTSTNFQYLNKMVIQCEQTIEFLRKMNQTQGSNRNKIKFQKKNTSNSPSSKTTNAKAWSSKQNNQKDPSQANFFKLVPSQTENSKDLQNNKQMPTSHSSSIKQMTKKKKIQEGLTFLSDDDSSTQCYINTFVRYSQSQLDNQSQIIQKGVARLKGLPNSKKQKEQKKAKAQHIPYSFKGSFRIKHLDDNKNILLSAIKKKATKMDKDELVEYLKKVIH